MPDLLPFLIGIPAIVFVLWLKARPIQNGTFSQLWGAPDDRDVPAWMRDDDDDSGRTAVGDTPAGARDPSPTQSDGAKEV